MKDRNYIIFGFLFLLFFSSSAFFSVIAQKGFSFRQKSKLDWYDFNSRPRSRYNTIALSTTLLHYDWEADIDKQGKITFEYDVNAYFIQSSSWVKPKYKTAHLLKHEQLHFDITELHARMLRKYLANYDFSGHQDILRKFKDSYYKSQHIEAKNQSLYDISFAKASRDIKIYWNKYTTAIGKDLDQFYNTIEVMRKTMQKEYDVETKHSVDKDAQRRWNRYIALALREYEDFK